MTSTEKTDAALIDLYGGVVGIVTTAQPSGYVRYFYQESLDGSPVGSKIGRISRSKRNLETAFRQLDPCGYYLTSGPDFFDAE